MIVGEVGTGALDVKFVLDHLGHEHGTIRGQQLKRDASNEDSLNK